MNQWNKQTRRIIQKWVKSIEFAIDINLKPRFHAYSKLERNCPLQSLSFWLFSVLLTKAMQSNQYVTSETNSTYIIWSHVRSTLPPPFSISVLPEVVAFSDYLHRIFTVNEFISFSLNILHLLNTNLNAPISLLLFSFDSFVLNTVFYHLGEVPWPRPKCFTYAVFSACRAALW